MRKLFETKWRASGGQRVNQSTVQQFKMHGKFLRLELKLGEKVDMASTRCNFSRTILMKRSKSSWLPPSVCKDLSNWVSRVLMFSTTFKVN